MTTATELLRRALETMQCTCKKCRELREDIRAFLAAESEAKPMCELARACNLAGIDYKDFLRIKAYMPVPSIPSPSRMADGADANQTVFIKNEEADRSEEEEFLAAEPEAEPVAWGEEFETVEVASFYLEGWYTLKLLRELIDQIDRLNAMNKRQLKKAMGKADEK
jgi:hypothetical protein